MGSRAGPAQARESYHLGSTRDHGNSDHKRDSSHSHGDASKRHSSKAGPATHKSKNASASKRILETPVDFGRTPEQTTAGTASTPGTYVNTPAGQSILTQRTHDRKEEGKHKSSNQIKDDKHRASKTAARNSKWSHAKEPSRRAKSPPTETTPDDGDLTGPDTNSKPKGSGDKATMRVEHTGKSKGPIVHLDMRQGDEAVLQDGTVLQLRKIDPDVERKRIKRILFLGSFDVLGFVTNRMNLVTGGSKYLSLLQVLLITFGTIALIFYSYLHPAWGCYDTVYGHDYSIKLLDRGLCSLKTPPNIGSLGLDNKIENMNYRLVAYLTIGAACYFFALINVCISYGRVRYKELKMVDADAKVVAHELYKRDHKKYAHYERARHEHEHWWNSHSIPKFQRMHIEYIYANFFDVFAYALDTTCLVADGLWPWTLVRIALNVLTVVWMVLPMWLGSFPRGVYTGVIVGLQGLSLLIFVVRIIHFHVIEREIKAHWVRHEITELFGSRHLPPLAVVEEILAEQREKTEHETKYSHQRDSLHSA